MGDSTLKQQEESYRQLSADEVIDIYSRSRLEGAKRSTDPVRERWTWKEFSYILALVLIFGLILIEYIG